MNAGIESLFGAPPAFFACSVAGQPGARYRQASARGGRHLHVPVQQFYTDPAT
jgi:hypothetical protein